MYEVLTYVLLFYFVGSICAIAWAMSEAKRLRGEVDRLRAELGR